MNNIIITGANGFIGSFLVEKALLLGWNVWAGVRKTSNLEYLRDHRIQFIDLNFSDKEILRSQLSDFIKDNGSLDYFVHNAGITKCLDEKDFEKVNSQNTANLIDVINELGVDMSKFVLMSSLSAYGVGDEINYTPIKSADIPNPNTAYGISKMNAERYLIDHANFPYMIMRPTGVYGPREKDYYLMLKTVKMGLDIGAGFKDQHLTFIYVKDLVEAVFLALQSPISSRAYFVADGDVYTDKEYTTLVKKVLNKDFVIRLKIPLFILKGVSVVSELFSKITKKPSTLNRDKYKIMKQRNWECDIEPLKKDLGFQPQYNLEKGLTESVIWYKQENWL